ncbi:hypothetical protein ADIS_0569 [Lunatimonas lonarensis]|uniref:Microcin J25-processing protein McjB C-terminal domain-containing protein n=1 Tax=Lunatimonas lonarensis TaxID=1232681 RepID=R7ZXU5_9BACT|nr:lasso peptide biosynthesis B2 protein [Lunatimonas lonarensis]EON78976.1 hypothetical protein ADIS_0569 [Lunatimonas lonarensis]
MRGILNKVRSFFRLNARRRSLFFQVVFLSLYRGVLVFFNSPLASSERMYQQDAVGLNGPISEDQMALIADIAAAVRLGVKYIPWLNVCRHQAWQAIKLLRRYKIPYSYHVGLKKIPTNGKREAHAWVIAGGYFISGRCRLDEYLEIKF